MNTQDKQDLWIVMAILAFFAAIMWWGVARKK